MRIVSLVATAVAGLAGCDTDEARTSAEPFATLELGRGARVTFTALDGGGVAVGEVGPAADPGYVSSLAGAGASPLEMWLALSEDPVPEALVENHLAFGAEIGAAPEPRRFTFDPDDSAEIIVDQLYGANCTFASDNAWFDDTRQDAGWTWHWYWSSSAAGGKYSPSTASTSSFHTHLCNYSRGPGVVQHCADGDQFQNLACQYVPIGDRSVFVVLGTTDVWRGLHTGWSGNTGNTKLGAMAP